MRRNSVAQLPQLYGSCSERIPRFSGMSIAASVPLVAASEPYVCTSEDMKSTIASSPSKPIRSSCPCIQRSLEPLPPESRAPSRQGRRLLTSRQMRSSKSAKLSRLVHSLRIKCLKVAWTKIKEALLLSLSCPADLGQEGRGRGIAEHCVDRDDPHLEPCSYHLTKTAYNHDATMITMEPSRSCLHPAADHFERLPKPAGTHITVDTKSQSTSEMLQQRSLATSVLHPTQSARDNDLISVGAPHIPCVSKLFRERFNDNLIQGWKDRVDPVLCSDKHGYPLWITRLRAPPQGSGCVYPEVIDGIPSIDCAQGLACPLPWAIASHSTSVHRVSAGSHETSRKILSTSTVTASSSNAHLRTCPGVSTPPVSNQSNASSVLIEDATQRRNLLDVTQVRVRCKSNHTFKDIKDVLSETLGRTDIYLAPRTESGSILPFKETDIIGDVSQLLFFTTANDKG